MSKQWFVTMEPLAEKALQAVERGELTIMPERFEKVFMINYLFIQQHMTPSGGFELLLFLLVIIWCCNQLCTFSSF